MCFATYLIKSRMQVRRHNKDVNRYRLAASFYPAWRQSTYDGSTVDSDDDGDLMKTGKKQHSSVFKTTRFKRPTGKRIRLRAFFKLR